MKYFLTLNLLLGLGFVQTALAGVYSYEFSKTFGEVQNSLYSAAKSKSDLFYTEFQTAYKKGCEGASQDGKYSFLDVELNCGFNLQSYFSGQKQKLINATLSDFPELPELGELTAKGVDLELMSPISVSAELTPIKNRDFKIKNLNTLSVIGEPDRNQIIDNVFVKHIPDNESVVSAMCVNLPGSEIKTSVSEVQLFAVKKLFWFLKLKAKMYVEVDLGSYIYRDAQLCTATKISLDPEEMRAERILVRPKFSKISVAGLHVHKVQIKGANLFTRLLIGLFKFFKGSIDAIAKRYLSEMLRGQVSQYIAVSNATMTNGTVWDAVNSQVVNKSQVRMVRDLDNAVNSQLLTTGFKPATLNSKQIDGLCSQNKKALEQKYGVFLADFDCSDIITDATVSPLDSYLSNKSQGCFDGYYLLNPSQSSSGVWWKTECELGVRLQVFTSAEFDETYKCLVDASKNPATADQKCIDLLTAEYLKISEEDALKVIDSQSLAELQSKISPSVYNRIQSRVGYL